jgi:hypothetical protein
MIPHDATARPSTAIPALTNRDRPAASQSWGVFYYQRRITVAAPQPRLPDTSLRKEQNDRAPMAVLLVMKARDSKPYRLWRVEVKNVSDVF